MMFPTFIMNDNTAWIYKYSHCDF